MPSVAQWEGLLPVLVTKTTVAVKELLTSLLVGHRASPPELSREDVVTRSAQCWDFLVFSYQWFVCFPYKSSGPLSPRDPTEKGVFLRVVVDILSVMVRHVHRLFNPVCVCVSHPFSLCQSFAILLVVEILLDVFRSLRSFVLRLRSLYPLAILWIVGVSLAPSGIVRSNILTPELGWVKEADQ
jgi:hypothetical protein